MSRRVIVTAGTGTFYCNNLDRLLKSFETSCNIYKKTNDGYWHTPNATNKKIDLLCWYDCFPEGSRPHEESPYGFKVFAIKSAYEKGYTSVLWIDSAAYAVKEDISPIFEKIEKEGYYAMSHIDPLENWVGNNALTAYGYDREMLKGLNLPSGSCYGFRIDGPMPNNWPLCDTPEFFWDLYLQEQDGMFESEKISEGKWHRHDEAALALCLLSRGLPVFTFDPLFQSDSPECVIKSGG